MKKIIIAIHGLGNKPEASLLRDSWLEAIQEGLNREGKPRRKIPFEMVYWADISYPEPLNPDIEDTSNPLFLDEPYTASPTSAYTFKISRTYMRALKFIENHLDRLFLKKDLSEKFPDVSAKLMERFFSDLDTYYTDECTTLDHTDCSAKAAIQSRLVAALKKYADYEILLISHSMGSIVAFDVLSNPDYNFNIHTFVTMGSPLGIPPIVARIFQTQKLYQPDLNKPRGPECIWPHWYNVSDLRDTVALDHTLRDDYDTNSKGLRAVDLLTINDYEVNGEPNPHKSFGYLRSPQVSRIVDVFLSDRRDHRLVKTCELIVGNIAASTRRFWKKVSAQ